MHKSNEITKEQILMLVLVNSKEKSVVPFKDFEKWQASSMLEDLGFTNYTANTDHQNCVNQQQVSSPLLF